MSGAVILIILISVGFGLVYINMSMMFNNESAYRVSRYIDAYRAETMIKITNVTIVSLQKLNITISNIGNSKIWKYNLCDLIVTYTANVSNVLYRLTTRLSYSQSGNPGTWSLSKIVNDYVDPGILNPNESMIISAVLPYPAAHNSSMVLVFGTDNGVWSSYGVRVV